MVKQGDALWSLGLLGESRLNVSVAEDGLFHCYDHEADEDAAFVTTSEVERWLTQHDAEAKRGPSEMLLIMVSQDNWDVFKRHEFTLLVRWSDGAFAAFLPYRYDASISPVLAEAIIGAAELLCRLFGAPIELAPRLPLNLELDPTATRQLQHPGP